MMEQRRGRRQRARIEWIMRFWPCDCLTCLPIKVSTTVPGLFDCAGLARMWHDRSGARRRRGDSAELRRARRGCERGARALRRSSPRSNCARWRSARSRRTAPAPARRARSCTCRWRAWKAALATPASAPTATRRSSQAAPWGGSTQSGELKCCACLLPSSSGLFVCSRAYVPETSSPAFSVTAAMASAARWRVQGGRAARARGCGRGAQRPDAAQV